MSDKPIYVFATIVHAPEGRDFAFAEDRDKRSIFLHASRARKIETRDGGRLWLADTPETEPAQRYAKVYVQVVRGERGWRALRWGYVPREREDLRDRVVYKKAWHEELDEYLSRYAGGMMHVINRSERDGKAAGEIASVVIDRANDRLVITLRWFATKRTHEHWKNSPAWTKVFGPLSDTHGKHAPYGSFLIEHIFSREALRLDPASEHSFPKREEVVGLTPNPDA